MGSVQTSLGEQSLLRRCIITPTLIRPSIKIEPSGNEDITERSEDGGNIKEIQSSVPKMEGISQRSPQQSDLQNQLVQQGGKTCH